jgi:crotonobetainyl-CoA:carnitine CoA-transferase CaiB-like acyl-CoA transferase
MTLDHPRAGKVRLLAHPVRYDGEVPPVRIQPPALGEHNREILRGLGYDSETIENLKSQGVLGRSAEQDGVTEKDA